MMEPGNKEAVSVNELHLELDGQTILNNISTRFNLGELTILLGPNGAGKSSLLKLISREWPLQGKVSYFSTDSEKWKSAELARHLGVLPQSSTLSFNFTVQEVVELGGLTLNATQKEITAIADRYMRETDITHLAARLYPSLSGGEKQRVHLARVLTQLEQGADKKIVLLDEPTSALDLSHQHRTLQLAKSLTRSGACVITVLHDLNLAAQYADRILILNRGELVADGSPWETLSAEKIAEVYQWPVRVIPHPDNGYPLILA